MKIACGVCHTGQARALQPVTQGLVAAGHVVTVMLDPRQSAYNVFERGDLQFPGCDIVIPSTHDFGVGRISEIVDWADVVLVTMSPANLLENTERLMAGAAITAKKKLFGYAEVVCGHMDPIWRDHLTDFHALFVAKRTHDLEFYVNVVEVGMDIPKLDPIRALATKASLGFRENDPWVWYCGGPYHQAGIVLRHVVYAVSRLRASRIPRLQLVFSRHGRDANDLESDYAYLGAVQFAEQLDVPVVENSADHGFCKSTPRQREHIIPYSLLLEACSAQGVLITGHGTDGIKAPYLRIPSILCVGSSMDPHILREKGCEKLPLPKMCPMQITQPADIEGTLGMALACREEYRSRCEDRYSEQDNNPAQIIAAHMKKE